MYGNQTLKKKHIMSSDSRYNILPSYPTLSSCLQEHLLLTNVLCMYVFILLFLP